jgi:hypothetical protein
MRNISNEEKNYHFRLFSRRHFPKEYVTYCGLDYETDRFWTYQFNDLEILPRAKYTIHSLFKLLISPSFSQMFWFCFEENQWYKIFSTRK